MLRFVVSYSLPEGSNVTTCFRVPVFHILHRQMTRRKIRYWRWRQCGWGHRPLAPRARFLKPSHVRVVFDYLTNYGPNDQNHRSQMWTAFHLTWPLHCVCDHMQPISWKCDIQTSGRLSVDIKNGTSHTWIQSSDCKASICFGLRCLSVFPCPSFPKSPSPHENTSPVSVTAKLCPSDPQELATWMTTKPAKMNKFSCFLFQVLSQNSKEAARATIIKSGWSLYFDQFLKLRDQALDTKRDLRGSSPIG